MKPRHVVLAAVVLPVLGCVVGGNGDDDQPTGTTWDQPEISGIWVRETDDGDHVVREFFGGADWPDLDTRTTNEWFYPAGEGPVLYSHGVYFVEDGYLLPTGEVADDVLYVYPDRVEPVYYDLIIDVNDDELVLQGIYDDEPVTYTRADELP